MSDEQREGPPPDERREEESGARDGGPPHPPRPLRPLDEDDAPRTVPLPGRLPPSEPPSVPLPRERPLPASWATHDEPGAAAGEGTVPLPRATRRPESAEADLERTMPLPGEAWRPEPEPRADAPLHGEAPDVPRWPPAPETRLPEPPPAAPPPPAEAAAAPPPPADRPRPEPASEFDVARLAAAARARGDEQARSYRGLVQDVERYLADGYQLFGMVGYPQSGKSHALQALSKVMHGFDAPARARFRQERAPGPSERWPFYYAFDDGRRKRVFMDVGGELYEKLHSNDWEETEATAGLLHTVAHCRGLLLLLHLQPGHLVHGASGFAAGMSEAERQAERKAQTAQEELEFFDQFLLFTRALRSERGDLAALLQRAAAAPLGDTLRSYESSPRLDLPVAVLFTQADRLHDGGDFGAGEDEYTNPLTVHGVAPFVGRNLPTLLGSLLRHARRFRFDFAQSYVERPGPGDGQPIWAYRNEPLSVGLLPAVEFLERNLPARDGRPRPWDRRIETRAALKLDRLLHPRRWRDVEVEL